MAIGAFAAHLAGVRILAAMATFAIFRQFCTRVGRVTGMAVEFGVRALQRKFMPREMIVDNRMPLVVVMAILALRAKAPRVRVVGAMATIAILGDLLLVVAAAMAGEAVDVGVHAEQGIVRLLQVIELSGLPLLGGVAFGAVGTSGTAMFIVGGMAAHATFRRRLVAPADMAAIAGKRQVSAAQTEFSLAMVEFAPRPAQGAVTIAAGLRELAVVHIVRFVAAQAIRRSLTPAFRVLVAGGAIDRCMRPLERELRQRMIELCLVELRYIRIAALVFAMTGAALAGAGVRHAPMKVAA